MADIKNKLKNMSNGNMKTMMIEQKLSSLFYTKRDPIEESRFIKVLLEREGASQERVGLHASSMLESDNKFCLRQQVLSLFFKQIQNENIPNNLKRIFEEGNSIHQKWQRLFIAGGLGTPEDMDRHRFVKKYDLSYTPDARIRLFGEDILVEIKSMNTYAFKKATGHPSGEKQLNFYLCLEKLEWGFVLAEDKNDQSFKVFIVKKDLEAAKPYLKRLVKIQDAKQHFLDTKKMPPRICENCDCKIAEKCNMRDACFNIGMGRKKL
jgi:hypothetical protein